MNTFLNTIKSLRQLHNISPAISDERLEAALVSARRNLRRLCGSKALENTVNYTHNIQVLEHFTLAEAQFALYALLTTTGRRLDIHSGLPINGTELQTKRAAYRDKAYRLIENYKPERQERVA